MSARDDDHLTIRDGRADVAPASTLLAAMYEELHTLYAEVEGDLDSVPAGADEMAAPHGCFLIIEEAAEPLACGGVKRFEPGVAEIKRMFVTPAARGRGIGSILLTALESRARRIGYSRVRLDTGPKQDVALSIYLAAGYTPIADYNHNPLAAHWLEKRL